MTLEPQSSVSGSWIAARTATVAGPSFQIPGVPPGRYRLWAEASGWSFIAATADGRDAQADLVVAPAQTTGGITLDFSLRSTEVTGTVVDAVALPAASYFVLAFPADKTRWFWHSRWIAIQPISSDGRFELKGLPPGSYYLAVQPEENADRFDPAFLAQLVSGSVKVELESGKPIRRDLRIVGRK
jgi:hypothetical protein